MNFWDSLLVTICCNPAPKSVKRSESVQTYNLTLLVVQDCSQTQRQGFLRIFSFRRKMKGLGKYPPSLSNRIKIKIISLSKPYIEISLARTVDTGTTSHTPKILSCNLVTTINTKAINRFESNALIKAFQTILLESFVFQLNYGDQLLAC